MKPYFKGLDTLRAIAAVVVVVSHVELIKSQFNLSYSVILPDAHIAVILFFVLSGFLITYLLMKEKQDSGKIIFRKFYARRIFRIWPLYYLIIFLSMILFPVGYKTKTIILCLGIFPNVAHSLNIGWPTSPHIWSIGVEEQFYLLWPFVVSLVPSRKFIFYMIIFIILFTFLPHMIRYINHDTFKNQTLDVFTNRFFYESKFNSLALGGIFGYLFATGKSVLNLFYKNIISYPAIILSFGLWFTGYTAPFLNDVIYSILFSIMIINLATNKNLKFHLESKISDFLGRISYGIYMYHWIIIILVIKFIPPALFKNNLDYNFVLYPVVLISTILVSYISFISFERYFLRLKKKHQ